METIMEREEKELVEAACAGDASAFEELVRGTQRNVYSLALRLTMSPAEADDITQEAFISAWKHLPSFRREICFKAWVLKIALNKCRSFWRWKAIRQLVSLDFSQDDDDSPVRQERPQPEDTSVPKPEQAFESAERAGRINSALDRLSEKQKEAALLRGQGLELEEIAAAMRTATGTIKAHLFQARRKLESLLREDL